MFNHRCKWFFKWYRHHHTSWWTSGTSRSACRIFNTKRTNNLVDKEYQRTLINKWAEQMVVTFRIPALTSKGVCHQGLQCNRHQPLLKLIRQEFISFKGEVWLGSVGNSTNNNVTTRLAAQLEGKKLPSNFYCRQLMKKRNTVQVRISKKIHRLLAAIAKEEKITMSILVDMAVKNFINRNY